MPPFLSAEGLRAGRRPKRTRQNPKKDPCSSAPSEVAFAQIFSVLPVFSVVKSVFAQFRSVSIRVNPRPILVLTGDWQPATGNCLLLRVGLLLIAGCATQAALARVGIFLPQAR
jgi:hypothetical protein